MKEYSAAHELALELMDYHANGPGLHYKLAKEFMERAIQQGMRASEAEVAKLRGELEELRVCLVYGGTNIVRGQANRTLYEEWEAAKKQRDTAEAERDQLRVDIATGAINYRAAVERMEQAVRERDVANATATALASIVGFDVLGELTNLRAVGLRVQVLEGLLEKLCNAINGVQDWGGTYVGDVMNLLDEVLLNYKNKS